MHKGKICKNSPVYGAVYANINRAVKGIKDESGSVESALVLIPLLILFLVTMQIGVALNFRSIDRAFAQSQASERAISGQFVSGDKLIEVNPFGAFNTLGILITKKVSSIPVLIPFIGTFANRGHRSEVTGIAVVETVS
jgi:hypothetical protein